MVEVVPFQIKLTGNLTDYHEFEAYDGFTAMAGFARTLNLAAHYVETGKIRSRGDFTGRHAVLASVPRPGSMIFDFNVLAQTAPAAIFGVISSAAALVALTKHVIRLNIGDELGDEPELETVMEKRSGDIAALVAVSEAPIRQAHAVIGHGASEAEIIGGANILGQFDQDTENYVKLDVVDAEPQTKKVTVPSFNANSGYGSIFDPDIGRVIPITMSRDVLAESRLTFGWALNEYVKRTGALIEITFTRVMSLDGRPKKYRIISARPA